MLLAESAFDRAAYIVDSSVKVHRLATDLDLSFVDMPSTGHAPLASVETF